MQWAIPLWTVGSPLYVSVRCNLTDRMATWSHSLSRTLTRTRAQGDTPCYDWRSKIFTDADTDTDTRTCRYSFIGSRGPFSSVCQMGVDSHSTLRLFHEMPAEKGAAGHRLIVLAMAAVLVWTSNGSCCVC